METSLFRAGLYPPENTKGKVIRVHHRGRLSLFGFSHMPNTTSQQPGRGPRQIRNTSNPTPSSLTPAASRLPWEIKFISLLAVALESTIARIAYFEAEDRRKAVEIDRLERAPGERRRAA
jgi:hypothetical protein